MTSPSSRESKAVARCLALLFAVPAAVMLWSYHPADCRLFLGPGAVCNGGEAAHNYMGEAGATFAYAAFASIGIAAWLFWSLISWSLWHIPTFRANAAFDRNNLNWRVLSRGLSGMLLIILFAPALFNQMLPQHGYPFGAGGLIGTRVFELMAIDLALSASGASLMTTLLLITGSTLIWNFLGDVMEGRSKVMKWLGKLGAFLIAKLYIAEFAGWIWKLLSPSPGADKSKNTGSQRHAAQKHPAQRDKAAQVARDTAKIDTSPASGAPAKEQQDNAETLPAEEKKSRQIKPEKTNKTANDAESKSASQPAQTNTVKTAKPPESTAKTAPEKPGKPGYWHDLLESEDTETNKGIDDLTLDAMAELLIKTMADFRHQVKVEAIHRGPVVSQFEISLERGTRASRIVDIAPDIARGMQAGGAQVESIRVVTSIPSSAGVGIEIPNPNRATIYLRTLLESKEFRQTKNELPLSLGVNTLGKPIVADLAAMPHLLVAGTTGSGKSVGINAMLLSLLSRLTPEEVRFILIDPKRIELAGYNKLPHLLTPVVTDMKDAASALEWCVGEMERRYQVMQQYAVRNIAMFNGLSRDEREEAKLPYIVVIADEFADMILETGGKVETSIARLAAKARAAGIHLVLATQRPSKDVVTGLISANVPSRASYRVSSAIESRIVLGQNGAEQLLGQGDMLFMGSGQQYPMRVHSAFIADEEVRRITEELSVDEPDYDPEVIAPQRSGGDDEDDGELDELYESVAEFVRMSNQTSVSGLQRQFKIGYNRAARIVGQLERSGVLSAPDGSGARRVVG